MLCRQEGLDRKCSDKSEQQLSLLHHGKAEAQPYWLWLFRARRRNAGKRAGRASVIGFLDGGGNQSFSHSLFPSQLASAANDGNSVVLGERFDASLEEIAEYLD